MNQPKQATGFYITYDELKYYLSVIFDTDRTSKGEICSKCMKQIYLCNCK